MKLFVNILALLFLGVTTALSDNLSEVQNNVLPTTQGIEVEIFEDYPSTLLNIITSRQSSNTPSARRINSTNRHNKLYWAAESINFSAPQTATIFFYRHIQLSSTSLVFKLHNIRI